MEETYIINLLESIALPKLLYGKSYSIERLRKLIGRNEHRPDFGGASKKVFGPSHSTL